MARLYEEINKLEERLNELKRIETKMILDDDNEQDLIDIASEIAEIEYSLNLAYQDLEIELLRD